MTVDTDKIVKGCCMTCGQIFKGNTRALVEGQFTYHIEENHKRKLNNMEAVTVKFFEGTPPKIETRKKRRLKSVFSITEKHKKRQEEIAEKADWV